MEDAIWRHRRSLRRCVALHVEQNVRYLESLRFGCRFAITAITSGDKSSVGSKSKEIKAWLHAAAYVKHTVDTLFALLYALNVQDILRLVTNPARILQVFIIPRYTAGISF